MRHLVAVVLLAGLGCASAPATTAALIRLYRRQQQLARPGSDEQAEAARRQAAAEKLFADEFRSSGSAWRLAHQADPAAIERARDIARQLAEPPR